MIERQGDLWAQGQAGWICFTSNLETKANGAAIMGAGVAKAARDRFPGLDRKLGDLLRAGRTGTTSLGLWPWRGRDVTLVALPTKRRWREPSDLGLVQASLRQLVDLVSAQRALDPRGAGEVVLTRPGCGNGFLSWEVVGPLAREILQDDRFVVVAP